MVVETMGVENPHPPFPHESLSFHDHAFRPPPILIFPRSRIKAFFSSQSPPSPPLPPLPPRPPWDNTTEHGVYKRMKPELGSVRISPENRRDPRDPRLATRKETSLSLLARFYYLLIVSEREREIRDKKKIESSARGDNFQFHVTGMNDIFEPPSGDRVHSGGRTELLDELLDNAAAGIEIDGGQEAGMLIPRNMRGPACSALLPRPFLPPSPSTIHVSITRPCCITRFFSTIFVSTSRSRFPSAESGKNPLEIVLVRFDLNFDDQNSR